MRKSFASVLQSAPNSACHQFVAKEPFLHRGEIALTITADEETSLTEPFKFTLVGKFSHRKPSMVEFIMGCPMRVLKWTCDFYPDAETPIAPGWISFPLLPVHLRAKEFLFALSKLVRVPLRIDEATADLLRPSEARVCVEVNLEHKLPDRVWIERVVVELPVANEIPLVDRKGKGKGKEIFVEPRKQWVPLASSSSIPPPVIPILPSKVHERPISEHSSPVTTDMASKPVIADTVFDPLLDHMMSLPREYPVLSESVQPVFDPFPHTHPDPSCHENVEASIPSDTTSSIQLEGHQLQSR
ncbi:Uncharacterized protein Adt_12869 [Abeliophyllum distichum]|uniref:DUF4283 domain-containing protein n=1 Tax=Abeliophyllum distichum TaxID=126358 RepID=A0ABD1TV67_9LAMI